ncbi:MAG: hypothetical protein LBP24_04440 [Coriobacteriales bacterium]|jgi:hypothetical protein|nr:hypothetical protein [Coriobacteriales bacterium]
MKRAFESTWGLSREKWDERREQMRALLVGIAQSRSTISYGELSEIVFNRHFSARSSALAQMLEEVCTLEDRERGVSLGAVVVRADKGIPGAGYFVFARDTLGRDVDPSNTASCRRFWEAEVARVWDRYTSSG